MNDDRHKKGPEAGSCAAYTIVSGAANTGELLLVRKQRATKGPSAAEAKFNAGTSEAHQIRAKILSQTIAESPMDRQ